MPRFAPLLLALLTSLSHAQPPLPAAHTGLLYASGSDSNNLVALAPDGTLLRSITDPLLTRPRGVSTDVDGNLVVVCEGSDRILVFDPDGNRLRVISHPDLTSGTGINRDGNGLWYVGNFSPGRVLVFDTNWNWQRSITATGMNGVNCVAFDASGAFAVTAAIGNRIFRFDASGQLVGQVTHSSLASPMSIAVDDAGHRLVSNGAFGAVSEFDANWNFLRSIGQGVLQGPQGIAIDQNGDRWVSNFYSDVMHRFDAAGTLVDTWPLPAGLRRARNIGFQIAPAVLAREGTVVDATGAVRPVLWSTDGAGNRRAATAMGRVTLGRFESFGLELDAPPSGPNGALHVLWIEASDPGASDVASLPQDLGLTAFATPFNGGTPFALTNTTGITAGLGVPLLTTAPAPSILITLPAGLGIGGSFTIQGLIVDSGSRTAPQQPISVTNALTLIAP